MAREWQRLCSLRSLIFALCLGALMWPVPTPAGAAGFSVHTSAELQAALNESANNGEEDTITLAAGVYRGNFEYESLDGNSLVVRGEPGTTAADIILDGDGSGTVLDLVCTDADGSVRLEGLTLRNGTASGLHALSRDGNLDLSLFGVVVRDNCTDHRGGGMFLEARSNSSLSVDMRSCIVSHNQSGPDPETGPGRGGGIAALAGYGEALLRLNITNSIIAKNQAQTTGGGLELSANEIGESNVARARVINSTITGNESNMLDLSGKQDEGGGIRVNTYGGVGVSVSLELYNTVLYGNTARGPEPSEDLWVGQRDPNEVSVDAYYCDIGELVDPLGLYQATEAINADPLFFDRSRDDYHLRAGSPCIDAGTSEIPEPYGLPATDIDGDPRIVGSAPDIGVDEARPPVYLPLLLHDAAR